MTNEDRAMLFTLRNTLDLIHVAGRDDLGRLLGCINAIDNLLKEDNNGNLHNEQQPEKA